MAVTGAGEQEKEEEEEDEEEEGQDWDRLRDFLVYYVLKEG